MTTTGPGRAALLTSLAIASLAAGCRATAPPASTPVLQQISGFGIWIQAQGSTPDTFRFAVRPGEVCTAGSPCDRRYPDTAFVDFTIPARTGFEVSAPPDLLTEVSQATPMGDYQYRKTAMDDGSGASVKWRVAVAVPSTLRNPSRPRTWCNPTIFTFEIVNVSGHSTAGRSAPLRITYVWGRCQSDTTAFSGQFSSGTSGSPQQTNPPPPVGDCPNGAFAQSFDVCERCGSSGLGTAKTLWGCTFAEAKTEMGIPGCQYAIRSSTNCP